MSYIKTQWFKLLVAVFCLVTACVYIDQSATITLKGMDDNWSYVEVWVSKDGSDVVLK